MSNGKLTTANIRFEFDEPDRIGKQAVKALLSDFHDDPLVVASININDDRDRKRVIRQIEESPVSKTHQLVFNEERKYELEKRMRYEATNFQRGAKPQIVGVNELVTDNPRLNEPVIYGLLREGETCNLIAPSKTGKSLMTLDLAIGVATGEKFLGTFDTSQGNVLILDNELHPPTLASRISFVCNEAGIQVKKLEGRLFVDCLRGRLVNLLQMESYFELIEPETYKLIILDALYRFWPPSMSENDNNAVTQVFNVIDEYAYRLGCCFVLVHHASKGEQGGKSNIDVGSGAGALARAADCHITIRPHENEQLHVLTASVRSWAPVEPTTIRFEFPTWYADSTEPKLKQRATRNAETKKSDEQAAKKILEEFRTDEFTANDVRTRLGFNRDKVTRILTSNASFEPVGWREPKRKNADKQQTFKVAN